MRRSQDQAPSATTGDPAQRYARHLALPEIGEAGQRRLSRGRVLVIGAGGLGAPVLLYLAAAGVGHLTVIDHDRVELSNLQRQVLYTEADLGLPKAERAAARLTALNSGCAVTAVVDRFSPANALDLIAAHDVVVDGTDSFSTRYLANDAAVKLGRPLVFGALQSFDGQSAVFHAARGPCYRCLYPQPTAAAVPNCAEAGVIGGVAGMVGLQQALQTLYLLMDSPALPPQIGRLWVVDARQGRTRLLDIPKRADCPTCSLPADRIILPGAVARIGVDQLDLGRPPILLDIREPHETAAGVIPGSLILPLSGFQPGKAPGPPESADGPVVVICARGARAEAAAPRLTAAGWPQVQVLDGGIEAWIAAGGALAS